ncbi:response regulator transcription factor [Pelagibacterium sp. H642]|uniref:response regulator transcription factor n=1 Tax=Pelagibacterium sp. H642 TaxID=1881069 RepID=UPI0028151A09|nr:response regulator transcription factor [Pelagibacterium sp. H642]WMT92862.1 response regulator transcription factor [Pelagibacterium sp. H642]
MANGDTRPFPGSALIADDDEFFRIALNSILKNRLGVREICESGSLDDALESLGNSGPVDLALFDLAMPGMESTASLGAVRMLFPETLVIVVSGSRRREDILTALEAGVHGYIPKGYRIEGLTSAIQQVIDGGIYVPPFLAEAPSEPSKSIAKQDQEVSIEPPGLTARQWDVLKLLVEGQSNKEIARSLNLGEGTVKIHIAAVFRNLGVKNRSAAAVAGAALLAGKRASFH